MRVQFGFLITVVCLLIASPGSVFSQETDVRGGFFDKGTVSGGVFGSQSSQPAEKKTEKLETPKEDTFAVPEEKTPTPVPEKEVSGEPETQSTAGDAASKSAEEEAAKNEDIGELLNKSQELSKRLQEFKREGEGGVPSSEYYEKVLKILEDSTKQGGESPSKKKKTHAASKPSTKQSLSSKRKTEGLAQQEALRQRLRKRQARDFSQSRSSKTEKTYVPKSVLSLIISGKDPKHLKKHLGKLAWLAKYRNIKVGNVLVVGDLDLLVKGGEGKEAAKWNETLQAALKNKKFRKNDQLTELVMMHGPFTKFLALAGMRHYEFEKADQILDRLKVSYSPTWIVRHLGRDYVFEGFSDPTHLFNTSGEFVRADY